MAVNILYIYCCMLYLQLRITQQSQLINYTNQQQCTRTCLISWDDVDDTIRPATALVLETFGFGAWLLNKRQSSTERAFVSIINVWSSSIVSGPNGYRSSKRNDYRSKFLKFEQGEKLCLQFQREYLEAYSACPYYEYPTTTVLQVLFFLHVFQSIVVGIFATPVVLLQK